VWSRNFLNIFATPLSISEYLGGLVLSSIATSALGLVVMLVLSTAIFGLSFFFYGALLVPYLLVLFVFGIALGVIGCGIVLRLGPASEWFIWPIPALISPFAGVFYPLSTLPAWMRALSRLLPPAYVFENMRNIVQHLPASPAALLVGAGLDVIILALAGWFFLGIFRYAVRTGLIARYSAETL
jgi:ABC-2 type transport system permease protein